MKKLYLTLFSFLAVTGISAQTYFSDDFEGGTLTTNNAWELHSVVGTYDWYYDNFSGDNFAEGSGFASGAQDAEAWLISPAINLSLSTMPVLTFMNAGNFLGLDFELYVSTTHTVGAFNAADWTQVTGFSTSTGGFTDTPSGDIDLTAHISGNTFIAFRYLSNPTDGAANWQIDDVLLKEGPTAVPTVTPYDIQFTAGPGDASPYAGQIVNTAGIVTAVVNSGGDVGYFIQSGSGAWTGVYVDDATNAPSRGDSVEITGTVEEFFGFTRVTGISAYTVATTGNPEPAAWGVATIEVNYEDYEGVLVQATSAECTDPAAGFGQWKIYDGTTDTCLVDDIIYSFTPVLGNTYDVTGPVWYSFSEFKILPRDAADIVGASLAHTIYNIQFTTDAGGFSPLNGVNVNGVKGIVVAESSGAFDPDDRGYWIQDGSGAWHGIFVWDTINSVAIGDSVLVDGNVNENFNQTIIRNVSSLTVLNSGNTLPVAPTVPTDSINLEKYEGVLMNVTNATCTNPSVGFGQWEVNDGSGVMLIDDVIYQYPSPTASEVYDVTGVIYYTFSEYKMLPRASVDVVVQSAIEENVMISGIYPNPVSDNLIFDSEENGTLEVLDLSGKIVASNYVISGRNTLSVSDLVPGMYLLRLQGYKASAKILVK